jgi:hypothetical protein
MSEAVKEFLFWAGISLVGVAWVVKGGTNGANFVKALGSSAAGFAQAVSGQSVTTLGG